MNLPEIDKLIFFSINIDLQNSFFDIFMPFITSKSYFIFLPFFLLLLLKDRKNPFIALALGIAALLLADWSSHTLKHFIERLRPCNELIGVRILVGCAKSFSMPSNHAVNAFAFATPFYIMLGSRLRYVFAFIAFLVGFSRIYVGVHYPSDVVAGAILGILLSVSVIKLYNWSHKRYKDKPYTTVLFLFLLSISLFRIYYIQNGPMDLSPDEAHYWEWSRRLDLSYYSKGPMIAYLIHLGTLIFGNTVFGIRFMAVIFSALSSILLYIFGKRLYDEKVGLSSAVLLQIIPLFSTYGILFTIDSPFIFFWMLSLFLFREAIQNQETNNFYNSRHRFALDPMVYWRLLGLSIGLGLLTKYTMAFFYLCAMVFLLLSREKRKLLLTKGPYFAILISFIVFSPVILWNINHDWVTLKHTAGQAHIGEGVQISLKSFFDFIGSQLGVITPLLLVLMAVSLWHLRKTREGSFLLWFSVPVVLFFLFKSIQAKVQANWALPGYITGIVAFSAFYGKRLFSHGKSEKILISIAIVLSLVITSAAHYPSLFNLPVKLDPASRITGWKELGEEVGRVYKQMSSNHPVFIFSDRYQVSSELAFYVKGHPVTYCVNLDRRMNQYDLWPGFHNLLHYHAIFVRTGDSSVPEEVAAAFDKVEKKVFTVYTKKHMKIRDYSIFMCYDFRGLKEDKPEAY
jgi:undecaprenyl-diphosphatase